MRYITPMESMLDENNTLMCKDFDSVINLSGRDDSQMDNRDSPEDILRQTDPGFFKSQNDISEIQSDESLFNDLHKNHGRPIRENFRLGISDFPEYKISEEGF